MNLDRTLKFFASLRMTDIAQNDGYGSECRILTQVSRDYPCCLRGAFFLTSIRNGVPSNPNAARSRFSKYRR